MHLLFLLSVVHQAVAELKSVVILHRHGDRFPISQLKKAEPCSSLGQLTNKGFNRLNHIGQQLRTRYTDSGLIKEQFEYKTFYFYSTAKERVKSSVFSLANGLFPPGTGPKYEGNAIFPDQTQPIPLTSVLDDKEYFLTAGYYCPSALGPIEKYQKGPELKKYFKQNQATLDRLFNQTGNTGTGWEVADIIDSLLTLKNEGMKLPEGVTDDDMTKYEKIYHHLSMTYSRTDDLGFCNATTGLFMKKILSEMSEETMKYKFSVYGGHDFTINSVIGCLNKQNTIVPSWAALVIIELHEDEKGRFLRFYRDYEPSLTEPLALTEFHPRQCPDERCALDSFKKPWATVLNGTVNDYFYKQCGYSTIYHNTAFLIAVIATGLLAVAFVILVVIQVSLTAPIPLGWVEKPNPQGRLQYYNETTKKFQNAHPLEEVFKAKLADERKQHQLRQLTQSTSHMPVTVQNLDDDEVEVIGMNGIIPKPKAQIKQPAPSIPSTPPPGIPPKDQNSSEIPISTKSRSSQTSFLKNEDVDSIAQKERTNLLTQQRKEKDELVSKLELEKQQVVEHYKRKKEEYSTKTQEIIASFENSKENLRDQLSQMKEDEEKKINEELAAHRRREQDKLDEELKSHRAELVTLKTSIEEANTTLNAKQEELQRLNASVDTLKRENDEKIEKEKERVAEKMEEMRRKEEEEKEKNERNMKELAQTQRTEEDRMKAELEEMEQEHNRKKEELNRLIASVKSDIDKQTSAKKEKEEQLKLEMQKLDEKRRLKQEEDDREQNEFSLRLSGLREQELSLKSSVRTLTTQKEEMEHEMKDCDRELQQLKEKVRTEQGKKQELEEVTRNITTTTEELDGLRQKLQKEKEKWTKELSSFETQKQEIEEEIEQERQRLKEEEKKTKASLKERKAEEERLRDETEKLKEDRDKFEKEKKKLKEDQTKLANEIQSMTEELEERKRKGEETLSSIRVEIEKLKESRDEKEKENERKIEEERKRLETQMEEMRRKEEDEKERMETLLKELEQKKKEEEEKVRSELREKKREEEEKMRAELREQKREDEERLRAEMKEKKKEEEERLRAEMKEKKKEEEERLRTEMIDKKREEEERMRTELRDRKRDEEERIRTEFKEKRRSEEERFNAERADAERREKERRQEEERRRSEERKNETDHEMERRSVDERIERERKRLDVALEEMRRREDEEKERVEKERREREVKRREEEDRMETEMEEMRKKEEEKLRSELKEMKRNEEEKMRNELNERRREEENKLNAELRQKRREEEERMMSERSELEKEPQTLSQHTHIQNTNRKRNEEDEGEEERRRRQEEVRQLETKLKELKREEEMIRNRISEEEKRFEEEKAKHEEEIRQENEKRKRETEIYEKDREEKKKQDEERRRKEAEKRKTIPFAGEKTEADEQNREDDKLRMTTTSTLSTASHLSIVNWTRLRELIENSERVTEQMNKQSRVESIWIQKLAKLEDDLTASSSKIASLESSLEQARMTSAEKRSRDSVKGVSRHASVAKFESELEIEREDFESKKQSIEDEKEEIKQLKRQNLKAKRRNTINQRVVQEVMLCLEELGCPIPEDISERAGTWKLQTSSQEDSDLSSLSDRLSFVANNSIESSTTTTPKAVQPRPFSVGGATHSENTGDVEEDGKAGSEEESTADGAPIGRSQRKVGSIFVESVLNRLFIQEFLINPLRRPFSLSMDKRTVYVGGLDETVTRDILFNTFSSFGSLIGVNIPTNAEGKHKGYAFIEFDDPEDASEAIFNMDSSMLFGRTIHVNYSRQTGNLIEAQEEEERPTFETLPSEAAAISTLRRGAIESQE
ncbi:putative RNA recognition domain containing protein [Blattamonas nauphoetae]|uniref:RNA recognition domain containing protein n=1 Tax=Blattamonas nauphoetae TaxID=2049346 RepID=A0ABQ9X3U1_9EUKA|nr:putative RNA recognition domain containing protein [Blattamonas nauphoetae]